MVLHGRKKILFKSLVDWDNEKNYLGFPECY